MMDDFHPMFIFLSAHIFLSIPMPFRIDPNNKEFNLIYLKSLHILDEFHQLFFSISSNFFVIIPKPIHINPDN